jgi:Bacterial PH domain
MNDYAISDELGSDLSSNEKLIWTGRPKTGIVFRSSDAFLIPFSLLWCGFAIFWESTAVGSGASFFFRLWGSPFVIIGLYFTIGRFFVDAKKRANTVYGITEDRIIIKSGIFNRETKSLNIRTISDITFNQKADNSGTITLGPINSRNSMMEGMEWPGVVQPPRLAFIDNVKTVYDKIIELQRGK